MLFLPQGSFMQSTESTDGSAATAGRRPPCKITTAWSIAYKLLQEELSSIFDRNCMLGKRRSCKTEPSYTIASGSAFWQQSGPHNFAYPALAACRIASSNIEAWRGIESARTVPYFRQIKHSWQRKRKFINLPNQPQSDQLLLGLRIAPCTGHDHTNWRCSQQTCANGRLVGSW